MCDFDVDLPGIDLPITDDEPLVTKHEYWKSPEERESGVYRGNHLQSALAAHLKKYTPYVLAEASNARYDLIAYISNEAWFGTPPKRREELACIHRLERVYCQLKKGALFQEVDYRHIPITELWGREFSHTSEIWSEFKDSCKCDNDVQCPAFQEQVFRTRVHSEKNGQVRIGRGLHLFEVKSEKDTLDRLKYQIPQMMDLADHVWLVLASNHEIPAWVPPFIGIIRHDGKKFIKERDSDGVRNEPAYYWQVLKYYGMTEAQTKELSIVGHHVHDLYRAWFINSVFHWSGFQEVGHQVVVDMSDQLHWITRLKTVIEESNRRGDSLPETQRKIETFFSEAAKTGAP